MIKKLIFSLAMVATLISCGNNGSTEQREDKPGIAREASSVPQQITVYRYGDFSQREAKQLVAALGEYFPNVVLVDESLELPHNYGNVF